ncbi:lantibiotic dehydratase [Xanthocytophaga flava]|uniref:lantibiotic dehydratase n=1 Tax=Xanthocytophaga flava TaxID=3048013 RepID=UPI0028D2B72A|nr:lantibiotic dehydratase [Xanthocytophaga flavus]MDJ1470245.1 lantibiotic dehydratase [Xanthocytophaga flavus]
MIKHVKDPLVAEAIFISSPDLYNKYQEWLRKEIPKDKDQEKVKITLAKYLLRMSYRCTPFGLFAGVSTAIVSNETHIELVDISKYQRKSRLDMDYLCAFASMLNQTEEFYDQLTYRPNNTLYKVGNQLRYIEYRINKRTRTHHLSTISNSEYIDKIIQISKNGASKQQLAKCIVDDEISLEEALCFIQELITNQVLLSNLEPIITGKEYLIHLQQVLSSINADPLIKKSLQKVNDLLKEADQFISTSAINIYKKIEQHLQHLGVPFEVGQLFQVDMYKPLSKNTINESVINKLISFISIFSRIPMNNEISKITRFIDAFQERFDQQAVPLLEVLDGEFGIGYPVLAVGETDSSPLLDGIPFTESEEHFSTFSWSAWQRFIFDKYSLSIQSNKTVINIQSEEIQSFMKAQEPKLASSLYVMGSIYASTAEDVDNGNFLIDYYTTTGPSAANLLGRFCHLDDTLTESIKKILLEEEETNSEAVFAEIVHINQARVGNISKRPILRKYEIPILTQPGVDQNHTISLDDLLIMVRNNRVILWSRSLNKQVIPRLSTAHNYTILALPIYHFLCDLQYQDTIKNLEWNWGVLSQVPFLPRVQFGTIVLSKARWHFSEASLNQFAQTLESGDLVAFQQQYNLPRWITVIEGDNQIPIDLHNQLSCQVLEGFIKLEKTLTVEECLTNQENVWIKGAKGSFTNEFIIPLSYKKPATYPVDSSIYTQNNNTLKIQRRFDIGSEWLYLKIFCGVKTADDILTQLIKPLAQDWLDRAVIDKWFFIRYTEHGHHLRIRFHGTGLFYSILLQEFAQAIASYSQSGLIRSIQTDTYQRELERYRAENITESESIFFYDSRAVVNILDMLDEENSNMIRWQLAIYGVDRLLNDFQLNVNQKKELMDHLQLVYKKEFKIETSEKRKQLARKYRAEKKPIENILESDHLKHTELAKAIAEFNNRTMLLQPVITQLRANNQSHQLIDLIASYVHMFLIRFIRSKQRAHELVIYDFLFQYYSSLTAKIKLIQNRTP